jgi:hypothetical protein
MREKRMVDIFNWWNLKFKEIVVLTTIMYIKYHARDNSREPFIIFPPICPDDGDNSDLKNAVFWDVKPCGFCKNRRFGGMSVLTISTRLNISEDGIFLSHYHENLKS